jgi:hypothetical protein
MYTDDKHFTLIPNKTEYRDYCPILKANEVEFRYIKDGIYNSAYSIKTDYSNRLSNSGKEIKANYLIDTSKNDVVIEECIVLNFTYKPITILTKAKAQYSFMPLDKTNLLRNLYMDHSTSKDYIHIYKIRKFLNPFYVTKLDNEKTSLEQVKDDYVSTVLNTTGEINDVYSFILNQWDRITTDPNILKSKHLFVATLTIIDGHYLNELETNDEIEFISISDKSLSITVGITDLMSKIASDISKLSVEKGSVDYVARDLLIVDPHKTLTDRYYRIAGKAFKIAKDLEYYLEGTDPGVYFRQVHKDGKVSLLWFCKLDEIDNNDFIFKTKESAEAEKEELDRTRKKLAYAKEDLEQSFKAKKDTLKKIEEELQLKYKLDSTKVKHAEVEARSRYNKAETEQSVNMLKVVGASIGLAGAAIGTFYKLRSFI